VRIVLNVISWILVIGVFSALGFLTDNPGTTLPGYTVFFLLVFAGVYLYLKNVKRKDDTDNKNKVLIRKIIGVALFVLGIITPVFMLKSADFPTGVYILLLFITLVLVAIVLGATVVINNIRKNLILGIIGYLLVIVVSVIPGYLMQTYDSSYSALGTAYYIAVLVSILCWWGTSLFLRKND